MGEGGSDDAACTAQTSVSVTELPIRVLARTFDALIVDFSFLLCEILCLIFGFVFSVLEVENFLIAGGRGMFTGGGRGCETKSQLLGWKEIFWDRI